MGAHDIQLPRRALPAKNRWRADKGTGVLTEELLC
jgi:hypothetical protein